MFVQQDMAPPAIIGSLAGYSMGIVALSILHAWFYERTRSVFLSILIHALFNTFPLIVVLAYEDTPVAVIANLLIWAVVIYLKRRHDRTTAPAVEAS